MSKAQTGVREEREPARADVEEVANDVLRIQLPISLPGLGHVNCYVLEDSNGVTLVDPGLPGIKTWRVLSKRLASAGIPTSRIHTVVVTHSHPDHFGQVARIQRLTGAEVVTHRSFRTFLDADAEADEEDLELQSQSQVERSDQSAQTNQPSGVTKRPVNPFGGPTPWGGKPYEAPLSRRIKYGTLRWAAGRFVATPKPTNRVDDADILSLGGREWVAVHTPGHTEDHLCLWDPANGVMISGDHVLPTITPHISGLTTSQDPLSQFLTSLEKMGEYKGVHTVLPAHGLAFGDLGGRCSAIAGHHHERLQALREAGTETANGTVEDYMKVLFKERSWGSMAESETYAHLEHLRLKSEAEVDDSGPLLRYRISQS